MELLMQEVKGCCDDREEEENEEEEEEVEAEEAEIAKEESSSSKHHQYPLFSTNYKNRHHRHQIQNSWLGLHDHHSPDATTTTDSPNSSSGLGLASPAPAFNFINNHTKLDLMDLSLAAGTVHTKDNESEEEANFHGRGGGSSSNNENIVVAIEKEHMFDKVVTPSDVGKLNRLVIPKQHAEKYFPLDSSSNEKGLLLNFEDRNGKLWRFRYSYWNSSQSYVMTKGWSRFVKEKKLDAGDIVSFQRGAEESYRHRLYIDWRRRPDHGLGSDPTFGTPFLFHPNQPTQLSQYSIRWAGRYYSLPSLPPPRPQLNYSNMFPFRHQQQEERHHSWQPQHQFHYNAMNSGSGSVYPNLIGQQGQQNVPMIIDSVPVDHYHHHQQQQQHHQHQHGKSSSSTNTTAGKRLRLFGVNMECASSCSSSPSVEEPKCCNVTAMANLSIPSSSIIPPTLQHLRRVPHEDPISLSSSSAAAAARFQNHQKVETSMLFDLDPSLQYRR